MPTKNSKNPSYRKDNKKVVNLIVGDFKKKTIKNNKKRNLNKLQA